MRITYNKLYRLLVEHDMSMNKFAQKIGISSQTVDVIHNNGCLSLMTIDKICTELKCQPSDFMELVEE